MTKNYRLMTVHDLILYLIIIYTVRIYIKNCKRQKEKN